MWVSNARVWSAAAHRLLHSGRLGETQLGFVALYLCVKMASPPGGWDADRDGPAR